MAASLLAAVWWLGRAHGNEADASAAKRDLPIALVDVQRIFTESPRLKRLVEDLRQDLEIDGADAKAMADELKALKAQYDAEPNGSEQKAALRAELEKQGAEYKKIAGELKAEFTAREAEMYSSFYDDVTDEIEMYAKENGIRLVLRYKTPEDLEEITDASDARKALQDINQLTIFHDDLEVTETIIERLTNSGAF